MKEILWISFFMPYDNVGHAGGKVENYYIKQLSKNTSGTITLLTVANHTDLEKIDLDRYGIKYRYVVHHYKGLSHLFLGAISRTYRLNIFDGKSTLVSPDMRVKIKLMIYRLYKSGYMPSIIILQWTQIVLFAGYIRKLFPDVKIIAVEEDVTYLSYYRKFKNEKNSIVRLLKKIRYKKVHDLEISALKKCDLVILNNDKDKNLLSNEHIPVMLKTWCPYFDSYAGVSYKGDRDEILYYGAMFRKENYLSAIWFIEKVIPILDKRFKFVVVGGNPHPSLMRYKNDRVIITGFVDDISQYLEHSLCLVAPLVMGAGVKIKIIEAMSSGIPVLTNSIGIEGIRASNTVHYLHCETPEDYLNGIRNLYDKPEYKMALSNREIAFIKNNYDIGKSSKWFSDMIFYNI